MFDLGTVVRTAEAEVQVCWGPPGRQAPGGSWAFVGPRPKEFACTLGVDCAIDADFPTGSLSLAEQCGLEVAELGVENPASVGAALAWGRPQGLGEETWDWEWLETERRSCFARGESVRVGQCGHLE